jgi:Rrf2 family protein
MALYGSGAEYALHCLLFLVDAPNSAAPSARDMAEFQGISPSLVAKLFTALEKAKIVRSTEGIQGGFRLARPADRISILQIVDAVEGRKPLFKCKKIRANCILFDGSPPASATRGLCSIHGLRRNAESAMREELNKTTLAELAGQVAQKLPANAASASGDWFVERQSTRLASRTPRGRNASHD